MGVNTISRPRHRNRTRDWAPELVRRGATEKQAKAIIDKATPWRVGTAIKLAEHLLDWYCEDDTSADQLAWLLTLTELEGLRRLCPQEHDFARMTLHDVLDYEGVLPDKPHQLGRVLSGAIAIIRSDIHAGLKPAL